MDTTLRMGFHAGMFQTETQAPGDVVMNKWRDDSTREHNPLDYVTHGIRYDRRDDSCPWEDIQPYLDRLPLVDQDVIDMHLRLGKTQRDIARILGVAQSAVSQRLKRAKKRLAYIGYISTIDTEALARDLARWLSPLEIVIILTMMDTTCQTRTAALLNARHGWTGSEALTQTKVRQRFRGAMDHLRDVSGPCYHLLCTIQDNLGALHTMVQPQFARNPPVFEM
jgi:predicted transcriptional regulator